MKETLQKEYITRLRMTGFLKFGLNVKNKITGIGALAVPVLRCSFGSVIWRLDEIRKIDKEQEGF